MSTNSNEGPPPTNHTLRPHHLQILRVFHVLFILHGEKKFSSQFMLNMYRVCMVEIGEVRQAPTYDEFINEIKRQVKPTSPIEKRAIQQIDEWGLYLLQPEELVHFFKQIKSLVPATGDDDDETSQFARRSLFGYFVRRCHVSFSKLSFQGLEGLWHDWFRWALGTLDESKVTIKKDIITNEYEIFKTQADKKEYAQPEPFSMWEHGLAVGDELIATENLRRFFEQHFHDLNDSGIRQHALLNLARMHYLRHQFVACRKLLQEAITAARTSNDRYTLQHCIGLQNRLPLLEKGQKPIINELQLQIHPIDVLFDTKKLLTVAYQQPMSRAFEKATEGAILYDVWSDYQHDLVTEAEQWGSHCVQAVAWDILGNQQLASIEENVVFAFTESGGPDNTRLTCHLNRAYRIARQGAYKDAISILLDPKVWSGLILTDYQLWANEIWHILVLRASRRGQEGMYQHYLRLKRPDGVYSPRCYWFNSPAAMRSPIRDPLYEAISAREVKQAHSAIEPLLTAIWQAEFMQRFGLYRVALIMLADVGLEFGLTKWSRRILEEVMPQIINGDDLEQRGLACFTLARCIIAAADATPDALRECLPYLQTAESDYTKLEMYSRLEDVQFLISVVHHNLGQNEERDQVVARHQATAGQRSEAEAQVMEDWVTEVWDLVAQVGAKLAAR